MFQGAAAGEGEQQQPQRRWKDWVLERETELRLEVPDQDGCPVDIKVGQCVCVMVVMV